MKVDLVTGFLGAGKTTFITEYAEYLIRQGEKVAIIVNDYGAINVDRLLLEETLGDSCHLEMVIGGDPDCTRRRLKTKLIAMAMSGYKHIIVEPSGIFDVDDFFDLIYDEPLDKWYEIGNVISIVEADLDRSLSEEGRYLLASQISKAGQVVVSKLHKNETSVPDSSRFNESGICPKDRCILQSRIMTSKGSHETMQSMVCTGTNVSFSADVAADLIEYINSCLDEFKCTRKISSVFLWHRGMVKDEEFFKLSQSGYYSGEMIKLPVSDDNNFESLFFFHVKTFTEPEKLKGVVKDIFEDESAGNVIRLKGFIQQESGGWMEVNATKSNVSIQPISVGQELFIVVGENLNQDAIGKHWLQYRNSL